MPRHERARGGWIHPWIRQRPCEESRRRSVDAADRRIVLADTGVDHDHDERVGGLLGEDPDVAPGPIRHACRPKRRDPEVRLEPARVAAVVLKACSRCRAGRGHTTHGCPPRAARRRRPHGSRAPGRVERGVVIAPGPDSYCVSPRSSTAVRRAARSRGHERGRGGLVTPGRGRRAARSTGDVAGGDQHEPTARANLDRARARARGRSRPAPTRAPTAHRSRRRAADRRAPPPARAPPTRSRRRGPSTRGRSSTGPHRSSRTGARNG